MPTEQQEAAAAQDLVAETAARFGKGAPAAAARFGKGATAARFGKGAAMARGRRGTAVLGEGEAVPVSGAASFAVAPRSSVDPSFPATPRSCGSFFPGTPNLSSFSGSPSSFTFENQAHPWMRAPVSDPTEWDKNPVPPGGFMNLFQNQPNFPENSHLARRTSHIDIVNEEVGRTDKRILWTQDEDYRLMSAWLKNSMDPISGTDKRNEQYWSDVANTYNLTTPSHRKRNMKQVKDRWHKINKWTDLFHSAWLKSRRLNTSGWNDQMWIEQAHKFYEQDNKELKLGHFVLTDVWNLVRNEPKWVTYNDGLKNARKRKTSNSSGDEGREEVDNIEDVEIPRPIGQKAAKKAKYKPKPCSNDDEDVQILKEAQASRLKVLEVQQKISAERLGSSKLAHQAAKEQKEAKLVEKEVKNLEIKAKMMDTYNCLIAKDVVLMTDEEKAEHVAELKFLRRTLFPQLA